MAPKMTFSARPVVCVQVSTKKKAAFPKVADDGGFVHRLLQFIIDNKIFPAIRAGFSGGGMYCGYFEAEDAAKIEAWLREQGAECE